MQVCVIAVGKSLTGRFKEIADEYEKRLGNNLSISWQLIASSPFQDTDTCKTQESAAILNVLKPSDTVVLLDERGLQESNLQFARRFDSLRGRQGRLVFVIGGAYGINDVIRARASFVWALSSLVFPHQLVRIMLLEQLYRTQMILNNHPYHHK